MTSALPNSARSSPGRLPCGPEIAQARSRHVSLRFKGMAGHTCPEVLLSSNGITGLRHRSGSNADACEHQHPRSLHRSPPLSDERRYLTSATTASSRTTTTNSPMSPIPNVMPGAMSCIMVHLIRRVPECATVLSTRHHNELQRTSSRTNRVVVDRGTTVRTFDNPLPICGRPEDKRQPYSLGAAAISPTPTLLVAFDNQFGRRGRTVTSSIEFAIGGSPRHTRGKDGIFARNETILFEAAAWPS